LAACWLPAYCTHGGQFEARRGLQRRSSEPVGPRTVIHAAESCWANRRSGCLTNVSKTTLKMLLEFLDVLLIFVADTFEHLTELLIVTCVP
jgi:hypothetical protein